MYPFMSGVTDNGGLTTWRPCSACLRFCCMGNKSSVYSSARTALLPVGLGGVSKDMFSKDEYLVDLPHEVYLGDCWERRCFFANLQVKEFCPQPWNTMREVLS